MDRLKVLQIIFFAAAALIILRLFYWQFLAKSSFGSDSFLIESEIPASRGEIFASDGFPLVTNQESFLIYAKPHELKQSPEAVAKELSPFLISEKFTTDSARLSDSDKDKMKEEIKIKEGDLKNELSDKSLYWVQLARKVRLDIKKKVEEKQIAGVDFVPDEKRFYPEASMAAQLLGFVAFDKVGRDTGYFGLEGFWDRKLRGKHGRLGQEQDPLGLPILVGNYRPISPKQGASLYLSINREIQFMVEDKLREAVEKYGAKDGTVIIADPKSGKILAMATIPTYDPALRGEFDESLYKNPAVADTFEPGSIFKPIVMAAALDTKSVEPSTRCNICSGPRQVAGYEISTWNKKYHPDSTMVEVIQNSDNVGMTFVAEKLGLANFLSYVEKFGFGRQTGIDLQEESTGLLRPEDEWREIDLFTASFGQGIAVTPIQLVQAVSAIANHGLLVSPKVVDKVADGKNEDKIKPEREVQVISPETALQVTEMMVNAVHNGEARFFVPKGYRIAGKTGTAQIPIAGHYDPNKTIASFIGFAPADDPKFVMLVRFSQPSSSPFGSETAAPTFFEIAKELFIHFGIPPEK